MNDAKPAEISRGTPSNAPKLQEEETYSKLELIEV
jgi:hypothetical protein